MNEHSIQSALLYGRNFLKERGISSYQIDSRLLLMAVCKLTRIELCIMPEKLLAKDDFLQYNTVLEKRAAQMPVAYILSHCEFMSLDFYVDSSVLIPRPDTECLVELVLEQIRRESYKSLLDIGTGSGCIPISIGHYSDLQHIAAVDISPAALLVAQKNAAHHAVEIEFILGNLFENVHGKYDVIVSNPPYIETDVVATLDRNVRDYEPILALDGGSDGIQFYQEITAKAVDYLNQNAMLFFEIGYNQAESVSRLLTKHGFQDVTVLKDLAGLDRIVYGRIGA